MNYSKKTLERIKLHKELGFTIVENKDWRWPEAKCRAGRDITKIAQTNDKMGGLVKRIVWAIK